jgi:cell division protease FtsH
MNEAAIVAVRDDRAAVTAADLAQARDRILLGQRQGSNFLLESEKRNVAVHESGHALVAALSPAADPVDRVTILPSGMALGVTEQVPEEERHLYSTEHMTTSLAVRLGGRAAELVVFDQGSTGAANDLAGATDLATRMVREFGLSAALGPVGYGTDSPQYLGGGPSANRVYSEETQRVIDTEVSRLLREAEDRAVHLLRAHRGALDALTRELLEKETVSGDVVHALAEQSRAATVGTPRP